MNKIQPYLFLILLGFMVAGLFYPFIGIAAIICMLAPVMVAPFKGRYWCGNFCPRGSFYDTVLAKFSPQKPIPLFLRSTKFRVLILALIMLAFAVQLYYAWGSLAAVGMVFVRLIIITTLIGVILGLIYHQRTWCSFCPMGSMASWLSPKASKIIVAPSCVGCKKCAKVCPSDLKPYTAKGSPDGFYSSDCIKCSRCINICPKQSLSFGD